MNSPDPPLQSKTEQNIFAHRNSQFGTVDIVNFCKIDLMSDWKVKYHLNNLNQTR